MPRIVMAARGLVFLGLAALVFAAGLVITGTMDRSTEGWVALAHFAGALFVTALSGIGTGGGLALAAAGRARAFPRALAWTAALGAILSAVASIMVAQVALEGSNGFLAAVAALIVLVDAAGVFAVVRGRA